MEDERLDDEMDVLHQIELENHVQTKGGGVLVQDSQAVDMPLGVDRGSEDEDDDNYDNNNSNTHLQPNRTGSKAQSKDAKTPIGKVWKKKGQKRTTRRVLMKPSRSKPMPEPVWPVYHSDDDAVGVVETQVQAQDQRNKLVDEDEGNEDEDGYLADEHDVKPNNRDSTDTTHPHTTNLPATRKTTTTSANPTTMATATKDLLKKTAKKISATAHANYTRLKLRHKNTKGKSGARGRFGRR